MRFPAIFIVLIACLTGSSPTFGQGLTITRVEEDWELVLGVPFAIQDSPQISTWMSPTDSLEEHHFSADFNHAQRPDFTSGGFQVKAMEGEILMSDRLSDSGDNLIYDNEVVTWTQSMEIIGGSLEFKILNGQSQSWGSFGGQHMKVRFNDSPVTNLNSYSPVKSAEWAGVGFGGNRVESFMLKRLRVYVNGQFHGSYELNLQVQN